MSLSLLIEDTVKPWCNIRCNDIVADGNATIEGNLIVNGTATWDFPIIPQITWTPEIGFLLGGTVGTTGITYGSRTGYYYLMGNIIHFYCEILLTARGSSTGALVLTNFPLPTILKPYSYMVSWSKISPFSPTFKDKDAIYASFSNSVQQRMLFVSSGTMGLISVEYGDVQNDTYFQFNGTAILGNN